MRKCYKKINMFKDPRDKYYYSLQKKDINQLSQKELKNYLSYCQKMLIIVEKKARKNWSQIKEDIEKRLK